MLAEADWVARGLLLFPLLVSLWTYWLLWDARRIRQEIERLRGQPRRQFVYSPELEVTAPGDTHHRWADTRTGKVRDGDPIHRSEP